ncbi:MAG: hypothetical protein K5746_04405 [Clostridiales bacterium]|nr:hypothetical protein [Clostridiales bacterium]
MKKFFYALGWTFLFAACLLFLNHFFLRKDAQEKYGRFFSEERTYDVLFFGTSHIMDAVLPPVLWESCGLSSYNLGNPAETMEATEWTVRLALARHKPRAVVVDTAYIARDQETDGVQSLAHLFYDAVPLSAEKIRATAVLFPDGKWPAFLFPLVAYHTRWESMMTGRDEPMTDCKPWLFGAEIRPGRAEPAAFARTQEENTAETKGKSALRRIVSFCREQGVLPVLTAVPYPAEPEAQRWINSARLLAEELGVPFFNLFDGDTVNFGTDCYDPGSHLNPDGAVKVTRALGEALSPLLPPRAHTQEEENDFAEAVRLFHLQWQEEWAPESLLPEPF